MPFDFFRNVFDHVQIGCADWPESVRFYRTVLEPLEIPIVAETEQWLMFAHYAIRPDRAPTSNREYLRATIEATDREGSAGDRRRPPSSGSR